MVPPRAPSLLAARADRSALRRERGLACARHRPVHKGVPEESAPQTLLSDPVERGLDPEQGILFVIDGAKVLRKAIRTVFGDAPVRDREPLTNEDEHVAVERLVLMPCAP